jgi:hypothetical protein
MKSQKHLEFRSFIEADDMLAMKVQVLCYVIYEY